MPDIETPTDEVTEVTTEETAETDTGTAEPEDGQGDEGDTFPRKVVEDLRRESASYRDRAKVAEARADELAHQLHTALVAATQTLADPSDLSFDAAHLDDADKLTAAIDELTASKPHLRSRRVAGDVGQGVTGESNAEVDLLGMLRART